MKRLFPFIILAGLLFASCQENKETPVTESMEVGKTEFVLPDAGATTVQTGIKAENVIPVAVVDPICSSWLSAVIEDDVLIITVARNMTEKERNGKVSIKGGGLKPAVVTVCQPSFTSVTVQSFEVGDVTPDGKGMVYWVDPENPAKAKAVSLEKKTGDGSQWGLNVSDMAGAASYVNGKANTDLLASGPADENTYPAAAWCASLGEGWYLPAVNEMLQIFDIYNGIPHDSAGMTADVPDNLSAEEQTARSAFENKLHAAGAAEAFNPSAGTDNGISYWTSTEENETGAWYVRVGKYDLSFSGVKKTATSRHIRCVLALGGVAVPGEPARIKLEKDSESMEGPAGSIRIAATVVNGTLAAPAVNDEAASWCTVSLDGDGVVVEVSENLSGAVREALITVIADASDAGGAQGLATFTLSQNPSNVEKFEYLEPYEEGGKVVGIVYWVSENGLSAKVVSLKRMEAGKWTTAASPAQLVETPSSTDGKYNWDIIKVSPEKDNIPAVAFIEAMGEGWYMPSSQELQILCAAYHGVATYGECTDAYPNALPEVERAAQIAFDKALTDNGGDPLNSQAEDKAGDSYFSSTEKSATQVVYYRYGKRSNANGSKTGSRCIRAVKVVTK